MFMLADKWWVPTLRGVVAVIFGVSALVMPGLALMTMVTLFGIYAIVDGLIALAGLGTTRSEVVPWWLQLLVGVTGLMAGVLSFAYPGLTMVTLLSFIAVYAVVVGVAQFVAAIQQRKISGSGWLAVSGVVSGLFGLMMFARPEAGALAVAWLIGSYAIIAGATLIAAGLTIRSIRERGERLVSTMMPEHPEVEVTKTPGGTITRR